MARNPLYTLVSFQAPNGDVDLYGQAAELEGVTHALSGKANLSDWMRKTLKERAIEVIRHANEDTTKATNQPDTIGTTAISTPDPDRKPKTGSPRKVDRKPNVGTKKTTKRNRAKR